MKNKTLNNILAYLNNARAWLTAVAVALWAFVNCLPTYATDIGGSKIATGTEKLVEDATTWLLVIAPAVTIVAVIYYFIRKAVSDEMDHKKWSTRISTAIFSCIGVVTASIIIKVLVAYYQ